MMSLCGRAAGKFLQALKDFGDVDEEVISEAHLRTEYGSVQGQVRALSHTVISEKGCTCTVHVVVLLI